MTPTDFRVVVDDGDEVLEFKSVREAAELTGDWVWALVARMANQSRSESFYIDDERPGYEPFRVDLFPVFGEERP